MDFPVFRYLPVSVDINDILYRQRILFDVTNLLFVKHVAVFFHFFHGQFYDAPAQLWQFCDSVTSICLMILCQIKFFPLFLNIPTHSLK
ncbi:Uncharacterised protein [Salmonella enterica]|uniref:Uncharacterized protein n=1 Tax=Salmonella enterica TaxID=28901 RepID=A0A379SDM7_SALER|nr:Uncharacterised protein [Salmonella enterica]